MVLIYSSHTCILLRVTPALGSGGLLSPHPVTPSPNSLLRKQCWGWLLSDPHHQRIQLLRRVKAGSAVRRDMDLVGHRARSAMGSGKFTGLLSLLVAGRILFHVILYRATQYRENLCSVLLAKRRGREKERPG